MPGPNAQAQLAYMRLNCINLNDGNFEWTRSVGGMAATYAEQTDRDYDVLVKAAKRSGLA